MILPKETNSNPADLHIFMNMGISPLLHHLQKSYSSARMNSNPTSSLKPLLIPKNNESKQKKLNFYVALQLIKYVYCIISLIFI